MCLLCIPAFVCGRVYTNVSHVFSVKGDAFSVNDWLKPICVKCPSNLTTKLG